MTALQSEVLCSQNMQGVFSWNRINSLSLPTDPSVIFSIMGDGATSDGEGLNILFWEKTHQTGLQELAGYLAPAEMQSHSLSHQL